MSVSPPPSRKTAPNVRLVDPLKTQAAARAKQLGISLNALVAIAVRQYLDVQHQPSKPDSAHLLALGGTDQAFPSSIGHQPSSRPRARAANVAGASVAARALGRGARLSVGARKPYGPPGPPFAGFRLRQGDELHSFLTCPARAVPSGLVGSGFLQEYQRCEEYAEWFWRTYIQLPQGL
ncbi:hypothetical protein M3S04_03870 [Xanthomonas sp. PPL139]|uniref:hypothetical protein n=1 Tax=unclassified Xanthomonas TaxID=2643310 RepID=UPI00339FAA79